ncbi:MAG: NADH-quinone oxidoreductase subunit J family protein [Acidobacteriaceae bacterium]
MTVAFILLALITLAAAVAAMSMPRLIHCALALVVAFAGLGCIFLALGAEFVGLAQLLVYVGAVAILIVFAILLTRGGDASKRPTVGPAISGTVIALAVFAVIAHAVLTSSVSRMATTAVAPSNRVQEMGVALLQQYVLPLEVIALLLTAALIGAVILALREKPDAEQEGARTR